MAKPRKAPARKRPVKRARQAARKSHSAKKSPVATPGSVTIAQPKLGEYCANFGGAFHGIVRGAEGKPDYMLFSAVNDQLESGTFDECQAYAKKLKIGQFADYAMPTRAEQKVQWANMAPGQFKEAWYWSGEGYAAGSASAWSQDFGNGHQDGWSRSGRSRACAVRRVPIQ